MALVACDRDGQPDPHFPQVSALIELSGTTASCHKTITPTAEQWHDTSAWCEFACVYSGTELYRALHVDLERPSAFDAWKVSGSAFTPVSSSADCPGSR